MTSISDEEPGQGPVVRDRRRIDPQTGAVREPQSAAAPGAPVYAANLPGSSEAGLPDLGAADPVGRVAELEIALAERTADLQRLQAEYLNYKRRVDRDRAAVRETAVAGLLSALLPVVDDIDRAREHGELDGGFKAVAESLERTLAGQGVERFGAEGDPFDPRIHEAIAYGHSEEVDGPTCQVVLQPGYRIGERVLRPARVAVVEPSSAAGPDDDAADRQQPSDAEPAEPAQLSTAARGGEPGET